MEMLTFRNSKGEEIEFYSSPFQLETINGLGDVQADIQTQKAAYQHGVTFLDALLQQRYMDINFKIRGSNYNEIKDLRRELTRITNPVLGLGTLIYKSGDTVREIKAVSESLPIFPSGNQNRGGGWQKSQMSFVCPDPYFTGGSDEIERYKLEDFVGNFRFSFHFPVRFATRGDLKEIINDGDVSTPVKIEFRGPVTNPVIKNNTTGEFIKVDRVIPENYKLIIDTTSGSKSVEIVAPDGIREQAMHYLDLGSRFFELQVGSNTLSFITDEGNPEVYVEFRKRYSAV